MKLETFFEKFELFADAPNAVVKIRELILESAIRGTLVPQNTNDEPASQLFKRVEALRSSSVQAGKVRKQVGLPPVGDDAYLQIPPGWEWTRLGNTGRIFNGDSVSEIGKTELAKMEDGLPFIATKDVGYGRDALVYNNGLKVAPGDPRFKVARANAVLICAEGGSAGRKIGITDRDICFGNKLYANEVWEGIHHRYIFYVYQAPTFFREFAARMTGIIGGISRSEFLLLPIPLPPEEEQKRIVAKVDELMALCDRLEAQQQDRDIRHAALARASLARFAEAPSPANLDFLFHQSYPITPADLRKAILTLAVQGKLVTQDPNDELATESVRIAREQAQLPVRSHLPVEFNDKPFDIPNAWTWVTVSDVAESRLGKMLDKEKNRGEAHPYLRNTNVHWFRFELDSIKTMLFDPSELAEYLVEPGDVLICEGGHGIARSAVWGGQVPGVMFQKALHRVRPLQCLSGHFLAYCLRVYEDAGILQRYYTGAGIPHFTGKALAKVTFPLPPFNEQLRIVAKVDQLMALVDKLETQLTATRATADKLMEAVVSELVRNGVGCEHEQEMERRVTQGAKVIAA